MIKCSLKFRYKLICAFVKSISTNMRYKKVWFFNQMCVFNSHVIRMAGSRQHVLECTVRSNLFARSLHWLSYLVNAGNVECGPRHLRLRARHNWSKCAKAVKQLGFNSLRAPIRFCFMRAQTAIACQRVSRSHLYIGCDCHSSRSWYMWILHLQLDLLTPFNLTQQFNSIYHDDVTVYYTIESFFSCRSVTSRQM